MQLQQGIQEVKKKKKKKKKKTATIQWQKSTEKRVSHKPREDLFYICMWIVQ